MCSSFRSTMVNLHAPTHTTQLSRKISAQFHINQSSWIFFSVVHLLENGKTRQFTDYGDPIEYFGVHLPPSSATLLNL
ncbi:hypothetical protein DERF_014597 [Dermatophagoides farinae]|uniref:Uncharacterized protein n=1 Tax=Dermatophagoides farinae TaxID=6954 RepID=A0A922HJ97_DERFA|nr:hypothetical protein DERF_014597 [Dermatophagoides farinae]